MIMTRNISRKKIRIYIFLYTEKQNDVGKLTESRERFSSPFFKSKKKSKRKVKQKERKGDYKHRKKCIWEHNN